LAPAYATLGQPPEFSEFWFKKDFGKPLFKTGDYFRYQACQSSTATLECGSGKYRLCMATRISGETPSVSDAYNGKESRKEDSASRGLTILAVDDEPFLLEYVCRVLQRCGHRLLLADNGGKAWAIFEDGSSEIDLVLTDLVMPGSFDGLELAKRIRRCRPQVPVLFMTGAPQSDPVTAKLYRNRLLLKKPFYPDQLVAMVQDQIPCPGLAPYV
jgi:CheY-like chemotaxis protein